MRFALRIARRVLRNGRHERGQIITLAALLVTAVMGFSALAVDVGIYMRNVRDAQNDADAAVLAGARELLNDPADTAAATQRVQEWAVNNGVDPVNELECCTFSDHDGDGRLDTISAVVDRSSDTFFARVLGFTNLPVRRHSVARVVHAAGAAVCPWGLIGDKTDTNPDDGTYLGIVPGQVYALKVMTGLQDTGNFRVLDLGQSGASGYVDLILAGCNGDDVGAWAEGDQIFTDPKPGNMGQPTRNALDDYYDYEQSDGTNDDLGFGWCDVDFELDPDDPTVGHVVGAYDPHTDDIREGCERSPVTGLMGRVALVPVIDHLPNGASDPVEILGIASLYIGYWDRQGSPADTQVYGIFLEKASVNPAYLVGESDNPLAPLRIKLVE